VDAEVLAEVRRVIAPEDDAIAAARSRAPEGLAVPTPEVGALLAWAAATCHARSAVEVGAAGGVSGLWLLPRLDDRGVLTSIEPDPHAHGLASSAYDAAGVQPRVRAIMSDPAEVLPRLSDGAYDLVLLQGAPDAFPTGLEHARRLLRPGGMLLARGVLRPGRHADALARFLEDLASDEAWTATVLPIDGGLALATRNDDPDVDAAAQAK
jgi:predicted O-methyltransferase YrrM